MKYIEVRPKMKKENGETGDATFIGYYDTNSISPLPYCFFKKHRFLDLDTFSGFRFGNLKDDFEVYMEEDKEYPEVYQAEEMATLKKGMPYIEFYRTVEFTELPYMMLVFEHKGEYQKFKRILTEDLTAK